MLLGLCLSARAQTPAEPLDAAGLNPELELARARAEERSILDQLAAFDSQLAQLGAEAAMLQGRLDEARGQRELHAAAVQAADRRLDGLTGEVRSQLRLLYRMHRQGVAPVLFGADDPTDLRRRVHYMVALLESDLEKLRAFRSASAEKRAAMDAVEGDLGKLNQLRAEYESKEEALREQRAGRLELLERVHTRRDLAMRVMAEMRTVRGGFDQRLDAYGSPAAYGDAGSGLATADAGWGTGGAPTDWMGAAPPSTAGASALHFRDAFGALPWPVSGRVVRRFGPYTDPATGERENSRGIAVAANLGDTVRAVFRGQVIMAGYVKGLGQTVAVRHGDYTTVYTHLNGMAVRADQVVEQGQALGFVGNSGLTRGEGFRLGFELRYNKTPQDPLPWLGGT